MNRTRFNRAYTLAALAGALVLMAGCGSPRRGEPISGVVPLKEPDIERGAVVFQRYCHQCHPGGEGGLGPSLNDKPAPGWLMKTQVRLGLGTMPSFKEDVISE